MTVRLVRQLERDGLMHLYPLVLNFKKSPEKLKERFGKSLWKKLASNSFTRNSFFCKYSSLFTLHDSQTLSKILVIPSTILKYNYNVAHDLPQLYHHPQDEWNPHAVNRGMLNQPVGPHDLPYVDPFD